MKAVICSEYGLPEAFQLQEIERPVPRDNEVLVEVRASSVTTHSLILVTGRPFFVRLMMSAPLRPAVKTPGGDMAGVIAAAGKGVKLFKPGDEVFGDLTPRGFGALAEYVSVPEDMLTRKPANASFEDAAAAPQAALVALHGLRDKGKIQKGQNVLIFGASGGIGTFAVQIARYFGAEVTGVCSTHSVDLVRSLGADHVIDYTREDFTKSGQRYDLIFAIAYRPLSQHLSVLSPQGAYVSVGGPSMKRIFQDMVVGPMISRPGGKKVVGGWTVIPNKDLGLIKELIEAGKVKPVVDRHYKLSDAAEAYRYFAQGHARGKVVVTVGG